MRPIGKMKPRLSILLFNPSDLSLLLLKDTLNQRRVHTRTICR